MSQAEELRDNFFALYPRLVEWHAEAKQAAMEYDDIGRTLLGRKRRVHPLSQELDEWWAGFQTHTNHVVQGSSADTMKIAMVAIDELLDWNQAYILSAIHDELLVMVRDESVDQVSIIVKDCMEQAAQVVFGGEIPFPADVAHGPNWACKS